MLISAALKLDDGQDIIVMPCIRHGIGYNFLNHFNLKERFRSITEGFVDSSGVFYDRAEAYEYAKSIGQLSQSTIWYKQDNNIIELDSEDLY